MLGADECTRPSAHPPNENIVPCMYGVGWGFQLKFNIQGQFQVGSYPYKRPI